jgi:mannosyltransferase
MMVRRMVVGRDGRGYLYAVAALTAFAALIRFSTLDVQSFWLDEGLTVHEVRMGFGDMLNQIRAHEATPPLYFVVAWLWAKVFGSGEVGLRSLSALLGTATVPVACLAGASLVSRRAGVMTAALVCVQPLLVWYSQEARAYALLVLLAALSFLFFVRALRHPGRLDLVLWALVSALALATHYFAVFLILPEAIWLLLAAPRRRAAAVATAGVAATASALVPLLLTQRGNTDTATWGVDQLHRLGGFPKQFLLGESGPRIDNPVVVGALVGLTVLGLWLLVARGKGRPRRGGLTAIAVCTTTIGMPLVLAIGGIDYFSARYVSIAVLPLAIGLAAGFSAARAGPVAAAALCLLSLGVLLVVPLDRDLQRDDWRGAAAALRESTGGQGIAVTPWRGYLPLTVYLPHLTVLPWGSESVRQIAFLDVGRSAMSAPSKSPVRGFRPIQHRRDPTFALTRFRSSRPRRVAAAVLAGSWMKPTTVLVAPGSRAH